MNYSTKPLKNKGFFTFFVLRSRSVRSTKQQRAATQRARRAPQDARAGGTLSGRNTEKRIGGCGGRGFVPPQNKKTTIREADTYSVAIKSDGG